MASRFLVHCNHNRAGEWFPTGVGDATREHAERRAAIYAARNPQHAYAVRELEPAPAPAAPAGFQVETFRGASAGWLPASPAVVTAETAARRLRLYRAVRGDVRLYRIAPVTLPGEDPAAVAALPARPATGVALPAFV